MGAQVRDCTDRNIVKMQISILWIFQIYWIKCFRGLALECPRGKVLIIFQVRNLMLMIGIPNQTAKVILSQIYPQVHFNDAIPPASMTNFFISFLSPSTSGPNCCLSDPDSESCCCSPCKSRCCSPPDPNPAASSPASHSFFRTASNNSLKPEAQRIPMSFSASFATSQP